MMDFTFICKYCNKLFKISLESLSPEAKDLIIKIKNNEKEKQNISHFKNDISKSTIFSEDPPNFKIGGIDMSFVKVDRISVLDIISNLDLILENKICDASYKSLTKINEIEIKKIQEEISKVDKVKELLKKEIYSNN